jgi:GDP-L-fucose synthase
MNQNDKIYLAGHNGLVGSAILRQLKLSGFNNLLTISRKELDLTNQLAVNNFFDLERPKYVIIAAAKVGGIFANSTFPAEFIYENLMIEANIINASYKYQVERLLFLGSTCIYPRDANQPMSENSLLTGSLEPTNEPYAIAKIAGIKLCESYNRQYGVDYRSVMPTNLYGPNDNFNDKNSHVVPALISRFHHAKINNQPVVKVWGSGKVMREFLYVDDMAKASLFIFQLDKEKYQSNISLELSHINIGTGLDILIEDLALTLKKIIGYRGQIIFDTSKPDGPLRKVVDVSRLTNMGWTYNTNLEYGLKKTYCWYIDNFQKI